MGWVSHCTPVGYSFLGHETTDPKLPRRHYKRIANKRLKRGDCTIEIFPFFFFSFPYFLNDAEMNQPLLSRFVLCSGRGGLFPSGWETKRKHESTRRVQLALSIIHQRRWDWAYRERSAHHYLFFYYVISFFFGGGGSLFSWLDFRAHCRLK